MVPKRNRILTIPRGDSLRIVGMQRSSRRGFEEKVKLFETAQFLRNFSQLLCEGCRLLGFWTGLDSHIFLHAVGLGHSLVWLIHGCFSNFTQGHFDPSHQRHHQWQSSGGGNFAKFIQLSWRWPFGSWSQCRHPKNLLLAKWMPFPCWRWIAIHGISAIFVGKQVLVVGFCRSTRA